MNKTLSPSAHHPHRVELKLRNIQQLFNSMDPSPFNEKDLDHDAEEFIVSWVYEYPPKAPITLKVYLEQWPLENPQDMIREAIHHYFAYRAKINRLEFHRLMKQGRTSLLIGLLFLGLCLFSSQMLLAKFTGTFWNILSESLTIVGWVAMWRPMQIYLYEWWPLRRWGKVYEKLSHMPVEVMQKK